MVKIFIDPGHGGTDPGASGNGLKEKELTLAISKKVRDYLNGYENVSINMSRDTDKTVTLKQRTDMANAWGADYLIAIHINAGGGTGYEDYIYNGSIQSNTASLRDVIHAEIIKQIDFTDRGKKKANFHMLRESKMPAMLTENGFIDNPTDAAKLKSDTYLSQIAQGHVNGLAKAFGLKKKAAEKPPVQGGKLYKVQIGAFAEKNNADNLAKQAKAKGFDQYIVKQGNLYKVQIGAFAKKANADQLAAAAKKQGFDVYIAVE